MSYLISKARLNISLSVGKCGKQARLFETKIAQNPFIDLR